MSKAVLVSYKERNKVLHINSNADKGEVACLKEQFFRAFEPLSEGQVVTFQRFDSEWDSFVDLEEYDAVEHKAKLKAVVTEHTTHMVANGKATATVDSETSNLYGAQMEHSVSEPFIRVENF